MAERRCKRHPEHKQTKGVCPNCLRERLDQLSASSSIDACSTSSSSSSMSSSVSESPKRQQGTLRKSRSLASVIEKEVKEELREKRKSEMKMMKKKKKKERFWEKLISGGKRRDGHADGDVSLKHSKTLKEKTSSSFWLIFS
ncbi:Protein OCTOPUS-like protein [Dioscorea alata]|uniref:Protein OCTOPUS-like protein n=1 Tax=Dioscorea alata TaxID=55571 RepID=A0ACB7VYB9_DIOAL|nr:Protein OCTOPUS-like protein [Dioscorea alata]